MSSTASQITCYIVIVALAKAVAGLCRVVAALIRGVGAAVAARLWLKHGFIVALLYFANHACAHHWYHDSALPY